jgi:uncharacterized protein
VSVELLPLDKRCNLACDYCYQGAAREVSNNSAPPYNLDAMKAALLSEGVGNGVGFSLFGGESLLFPINDMERMLEWAQSIGAPVGCQTNGSLITERHIELFKRYRMGVGVSIDGPDELNDARQALDPKATRATTRKSIANLERLLAEGVSTSLIVTLTAVNAGDGEKLGLLIAWLLDLRNRGLKYVNLHTLEPHGDPALGLTQNQQIAVMCRLKDELVGFTSVSPFNDMRHAMLQEPGAHCTFGFCDPYTTAAVRGIGGQGTRSNCGRTEAQGVAYEKGDKAGHERQLSLYLTPMSHGGCGGCRFFLPCGGGNCPGEAEGGDWRRKTVHCKTLFALFTDIEEELFREGKEPISMSLRRPLLEYQRLAQWSGLPSGDTTHDRPHGDIPHKDVAHGDHTDVPPVSKKKGIKS